MTIALLIGFEYNYTLKGAIIDLYLAYNWCKSFCNTIYVITDVKNIENKNVGNEIKFFYRNLTNKFEVKDEHQLRDSLSKIMFNIKKKEHEKMVLYYSGHGKKESIILPNNKLFSFDKFRNIICNKLPSEIEIFMIIDCCEAHGLQLPFHYHNKKFKLSKYNKVYLPHKVLLITSSEPNENCVMDKNGGSLFSKFLFEYLTSLQYKHKKYSIPNIFTNIFSKSDDNTEILIKTKNRNLNLLKLHIDKSIANLNTGVKQTVNIYSSYIIEPILPFWIGSSHPHTINSDFNLSHLIIQSIHSI